MTFFIRKFFKFKLPYIVSASLINKDEKVKTVTNTFYKVENGRFVFPAEVILEGEFVLNKRYDDTKRIIVTGMKNDNLHGMALAISVNGEDVFKEAIGVRNVEYNKRATTNMRGNIASITKLFTAYLIMKMFEENKFKHQKMYLTTEIQHKDFLCSYDKHIFSIAHLLLHQGDIRHYGNLENYDVEQFNTIQSAWKKLYRFYRPLSTNLIFYSVHDDHRDGISPNRISRYTSLGYDVLGAFMEKMEDNVPYCNILTDELELLHLSNTFLHQVNDVKFDICRGYESSDVFETHILREDKMLSKMKIDEQVVEDSPYLNNELKPLYREVLSNSHFVNYSKKYPSEGLVANISDLIKFGDMFLRMDQNLSGGKPLSAGLTKLMWSYRGDGVDVHADGFGRHLDALNEFHSQCLGWKVSKKLHQQKKRGEKFKMSVYHNGAACGFQSSLYVTSMKNENYLAINDFSFARKAIKTRPNFIQRLTNRTEQKSYKTLRCCPSNLNCFRCGGDNAGVVTPEVDDSISQHNNQSESLIIPDSPNSSTNSDDQSNEIQLPHSDSLPSQTHSIPEVPGSSQSPDSLSSLPSQLPIISIPPTDHSFDSGLSNASGTDSQGLLFPDSNESSSQSYHQPSLIKPDSPNSSTNSDDQSNEIQLPHSESLPSQTHSIPEVPWSSQSPDSLSSLPSQSPIISIPPTDHSFDSGLSNDSGPDSQGLLFPDSNESSSQSCHQPDQSQAQDNNNLSQSDQIEPSSTQFIPVPHSSCNSQNFYVVCDSDGCEIIRISEPEKQSQGRSSSDEITPVPRTSFESQDNNEPINSQPEGQSPSAPSSKEITTAPYTSFDSQDDNEPINSQPENQSQNIQSSTDISSVPHVIDSEDSEPTTNQPESDSENDSSATEITSVPHMFDLHENNQYPQPTIRQPRKSRRKSLDPLEPLPEENEDDREREEDMRASCVHRPHMRPRKRQRRNDYKTFRRWMYSEGGSQDFADLILGEGDYGRDVFSKVEHPTGITVAMIVNKDIYAGTEELAEKLTHLYLEDIAGYGYGLEDIEYFQHSFEDEAGLLQSLKDDIMCDHESHSHS